MDIHILRDGKETGPFSEETVQVLLKQGGILINDLAWRPGMAEWLPLHAVLYPAAQPTAGYGRPAEPIYVRSEAMGDPMATGVMTEEECAEVKDAPIVPEPATLRQKAFLSYIGTPFKADLTKERAAMLVTDAMENPRNAGKLKRWDEERLRLYPDLFAEEIKAKRENRAQYFFETCETEGAQFFHGVTKAHTQVLVGFLDVRFPNWDHNEHAAKYDYFFPAISEKFPQLLTKLGKGRFRYPDGPRVAPEIGRRPVVVRARRRGSFLGAMVRGVVFSGIVLAIVVGAVKYERGELELPFDLPPALAKLKRTNAATSGQKVPKSSENAATASTQGSPVDAPLSAASSSPSSGTTPPATPSPAASGAPAVAATTPTVPDPGSSTAALPSSFSLFDTPPPPTATPTPAPQTGTAGAPRLVMGRINKPTLVSLKFGTSTLRAGTPVQVMSVDATSVKIRFGPDIVPVPIGNVDLP